jgi:hypothetical protein
VLRGAVEAVAGGPGPTDDLLGGRAEPALGQAVAPVEGEKAPATAAAEIVGAAIADVAQQAEDVSLAVAVEGGGLVAVRAAQAGSDVAVFF